jgi:Sugar phosphate permease
MLSSQFHFSHTDLAKIMGSFQISYAVTWLVGGILLDAIGSRIGLALAVAFWSLVNMFTGTVSSVFGFSACRFLLGIGEGFNWPAASKTVAEWFPKEERSLAVAIFDSGSSIGGGIAAVAIPEVAIVFGWRWSFVLSGSLGILWIILWFYVHKSTPKDEDIQHRENIDSRDTRLLLKSEHSNLLQRWRSILQDSDVWAVVLGRALTDPIWWFYVFWLPQYLADERGFSLTRIALFAWIPFVSADIGNFAGGFASSWCVRRGLSVVRSRTWICALSCLPMLAGIPAARVHSPYLALGLICIALCGFASWSTMGLTLPSDLFAEKIVATVTGLSGFAAGVVGAGFTFAVGILVDRFSYAPAFLIAGLLPIAATVCLFVLISSKKAYV